MVGILVPMVVAVGEVIEERHQAVQQDGASSVEGLLCYKCQKTNEGGDLKVSRSNSIKQRG